jgi:hypothetical protein
MKTSVDAIASESVAGQPTAFQVSITMGGGYPITEMATGDTGYVGWYSLEEAEFVATAILMEVKRARQALAPQTGRSNAREGCLNS